ncbi:MAG: hypothetical protein GXY55_17305 [Phycisphaerae bacterium]|nr:hypothetical protein [Phycisphaerae bacterium]
MSGFVDALRQQLGYMVSLPERTVRSLAAMAGGTTSLLTETLFPEVLRGTTLYRIFLGDTQRFMIEKVAKIRQADANANQPPADPQYVQKKIVGSALETAGLFAMHFSPLWVFAIAGDAAAGSNAFLKRLGEQLKANGVIEPDVQVTGLPDLLAAIQEASQSSVTAIDTPPLSREEIGNLANQLTATYGQMFARATNLLPRLETIWTQMEQVANRENISLETLGGILTIDVAGWARKSVGAAFALGQTGTDLVGEQILDSYGRTLATISSEGVAAYLNDRMKPFLTAAKDHFDPARKTWTESLVDRLLARDRHADATGKAEAPETASPASPSSAMPPDAAATNAATPEIAAPDPAMPDTAAPDKAMPDTVAPDTVAMDNNDAPREAASR